MTAPLPPIERLVGPEAVALRVRGRRCWLVVPQERFPAQGVPLGLVTLLHAADDGAGDPQREPARVRLGLPGPPALPVWLATALVVLLYVGAGAALALRPPAAGGLVLHDAAAAGRALGAALAALLLGQVMEAALLAGCLRGNARIWGLGGLLLGVERVGWRLGVPVVRAGLAVAFGTGLLLAGVAALGMAPDLGIGVATGALLYLLIALFPMAPTPGSRLLGDLLAVDDLSARLHWVLLRNFLAVRLRDDDGASGRMAAGGLAVAGWMALAGVVFARLSAPKLGGATLGGVLWRTGTTLVGLGFAAWLLLRVSRLVLAATRLREGGGLHEVEPDPALVEAWHQQSSVLRHVPRLIDAAWRWATVPVGHRLIGYGERDRACYWLATGTAVVLGRDERGNAVHRATLHSGAGVGEISLLDDVPRTADVLVREAAVVAILDEPAFAAVADDDLRRRLRDVVLASQALARAPVFTGMRTADRERWLAGGRPVHYDRGELVIRQGDDDRWIGLVADGELSVERDGQELVRLGPDTVVGEMAYLSGETRSASLKATVPTLLWRWDPGWLDLELGHAGVADALRALAAARAAS